MTIDLYKTILKENIEKISYYISISDKYYKELAGTIDLESRKIFCLAFGIDDEVDIPNYLEKFENIWHTHSRLGFNDDIYFTLTPHDIYEGLHRLIYHENNSIFEILIHNQGIIIMNLILEKPIANNETDYQIEMEMLKFKEEYDLLYPIIYIEEMGDSCLLETKTPLYIQKRVLIDPKLKHKLNMLIKEKLLEYTYLKHVKIEIDLILFNN